MEERKQTASEQEFDREAWAAQKKERRDALYVMAHEMADAALTDTSALADYLGVQAKLGKTSVVNSLLVAAQKPEASFIRSFEDWQKHGRSVMKGEKGIDILTPSGEYRKDVFPIALEVITTSALSRGEAIFGMADRYQAFAGTEKDGRILYSDDYKFLEDQRVYLIKTYANGTPFDDNSFLLLDIDGLRPSVLTVQQETAPTASNVATLAALNGLTLNPTFASGTTTYTAATSNATDVVTAIPSDIHAEVQVLLGTKVIENGSADEWASGSNTLKVNVVAEDGTTKKTYTVTVTKS